MTRPSYSTLEVTSTHNGESCTIETVWEFQVAFYPMVPATYLDPPEGGPEIDGDPELLSVVISDAEGNEMVVFNNQQHKEILEILMVSLSEVDLTPSEDDMWEAIREYGNHDDHGPW